mgnify:CR=1 FL=1|jgi:hypothetical protein
MMSSMKILNVKVRLAVVAFCKFMKSRGVSLDKTIEMVETVWGDEG